MSGRKSKIKIYCTTQEGYLCNKELILKPVIEDASFSKEDLHKAVDRCWETMQIFIKHGYYKNRKKSFVRQNTLLKWKVFKRDSFTCKKCGKQEDLEVDHIIPVTKGGKNILKNLQTLCKRCNIKKGNKIYG